MEISENVKTDFQQLVVLKYKAIAEKIENLAASITNSEEPFMLEMLFTDCIKDLELLVSLEQDSTFLPQLQSMGQLIVWQLEKLREKVKETSKPKNDASAPTKPAKKIKRVDAEEDKALRRKNAIAATMKSTQGNGLDDIAGLDHVKSILRKSVLLPMMFPSLFVGGRKPWSQILLFGPPGTGKSKIAQAVAHEVQAQLYSVSSADLISSWVGESEKMIKALFEHMRQQESKCVVFIDEIDSVCRKRTDREGDHTRSMKNQLLVELDQNLSSNTNNSFVLCATNCPWDIDIAFMRRFQRRIYIPLPDKKARLKIIQMKCEGVGLDMSASDWDVVLDRTEGYSGADLANVVSYALQEPLNELDSNHWIVNSDGEWTPCSETTAGHVMATVANAPPSKVRVRNVKLIDFTKAILVTPRTVQKPDLEKYKKYMTTQGY